MFLRLKLDLIAPPTAFMRINSAGSNIINVSQQLEGQGVFELAKSKIGTYPYINYQNASVDVNYTTPYYYTSANQTMGNYFAVFFNPNSGATNVTIRRMTYSYANAVETMKSASGYIFIASLSMLLGLFLIIFSFFMSSKQKGKNANTDIDLEAKKMYDEIERKTKRKKKHGRGKRK